jgi:hypothetical protein
MDYMERPQRDFKGVWIPREIWLSPSLSLMEKVIFVEIDSLDNERGCFASNRHFADFFGVSDRQIRTYVNSLSRKGFITVTVKNRNERVIHVAMKYARVKKHQLREFEAQVGRLGDKWRVKSRGPGSLLPGRTEENFHPGRK